jgi:hydrogenase expression/formation protein HypD
MGYWEYHPIAAKYQIPIVITGFEPLDLVRGITQCVKQLEKTQHFVENAYERVVTEKGNFPAQQMIERIYAPVDRNWRGIGLISLSGWGLRSEYNDFNAETRFDIASIVVHESEVCIAGEILRGIKKPNQCPAFRVLCDPTRPLGAPMVSSEGACSAYYRYSVNSGN